MTRFFFTSNKKIYACFMMVLSVETGIWDWTRDLVYKVDGMDGIGISESSTAQTVAWVKGF